MGLKDGERDGFDAEQILTQRKVGHDPVRAVLTPIPIPEVPISFGVPVYNTSPDWLLRCIRSIQMQTYPWIKEVILIDDCSTDKATREMIEKIEKNATLAAFPTSFHSRIKVVRHEKNMGIGKSFNDIMENVTTDFCFFVGSDDILLHQAAEAIMGAMSEETDIIGTFCYVINEKDEVLRRWTGMASPIYRTRIYREYGLRFDEKMKKWVDEDMFKKLRAHTGRMNCIRVLNEHLYCYRFHGDNVTGRMKEVFQLKAAKEVYTKTRKMAVLAVARTDELKADETLGRHIAQIASGTYVPINTDLQPYDFIYVAGLGRPEVAALIKNLHDSKKKVFLHWFLPDVEIAQFNPKVMEFLRPCVDIHLAADSETRKQLLRKLKINADTLRVDIGRDGPDKAQKNLLEYRFKFAKYAFGIKKEAEIL